MGKCRTWSTLQGRGEVHTGFWLRKLRKRGHLDDTGVDGKIILNWIFKK